MGIRDWFGRKEEKDVNPQDLQRAIDRYEAQEAKHDASFGEKLINYARRMVQDRAVSDKVSVYVAYRNAYIEGGADGDGREAANMHLWAKVRGVDVSRHFPESAEQASTYLAAKDRESTPHLAKHPEAAGEMERYRQEGIALQSPTIERTGGAGAEASRPARGFSPNNLQAAVDRYEQNMRDRGSRFERSDVLAQERSLAPDVVQKLAEYRGLRKALKQAEKAASVPVLGQEHVMSYVDAREAMSNWAYANRVQVAGFSHQIDAREHAQPGRSYAGPVVSLTDTHVVQQVGEQRIEHEVRALAGEKLTQASIGKEVAIEYPAGKFGLVRDPAMERKVEGPALRHEFGTR